MNAPLNFKFSAKDATVVRVAGAVVTIVGLAVLVAWFRGYYPVTNLLPGTMSMKVNTAVCFILSGITLFLFQVPGRWPLRIGKALALIIGAVGLLTLAEDLTVIDFRIDELLLKDRVNDISTTAPGRMAAKTALCFTLLSITFWLMGSREKLSRRPVALGSIGLLVIVITLSSLIGHLAGYTSGYIWWVKTRMAVSTEVLFSILGGTVFYLGWKETGTRWLIGRPFTIGFVGAVLLIVAISSLTDRSVAQLLAAQKSEQHTDEVIGSIRTLKSHFEEQQSVVQTYLITGQEVLLPIAARAISQVRMSLLEIRELTSDNPNKPVHIQRLDELASARLAISQHIIDTGQKNGFAAARQIATGETKGLTDQLLAQFELVEAEQVRLLAIRHAESEMLNQRIFTVLPAGVLVSVVLLTLGFLRFNSEVAARRNVADVLKQSEERLRLAIGAAQMGTWDLDISSPEKAEWRAKYSPTVGAMFGRPPGFEYATLQETVQQIHPEDRDRVIAALEDAIRDQTLYSCEFRAVWDDAKTTRWLSCKGRIEADEKGRPCWALGVIMDITERQLAAEKIAAALNAAEAANRAKDSFLAALSHDLRAPLSPVLLLSASMKDSPDLPAAVRKDFATIHRSVEVETQLINDLLDLTRVRHGKLQVELLPTHTHHILEQSLDIVRPDIDAKGLILLPGAPPSNDLVCADVKRLRQVFVNVLQNAVKFTPSGGSISVRSSNQDGKLHFEIADTGIGIAAEDLSRIFYAFEQGSGVSSRNFGGLGLGMSISRALMEEHHGRIWAESPGRGQGATFHIELPLSSKPELEPKREPVESVRLPQTALRILLVEDDEATRETLVRLLKRRGHAIQSSPNVATARRLASDNHFDLLISDIGLPDGNGCELMAELRRDYHVSGIALSGYGMEDDVQQSRKAGFFAHVTKPVDLETLDAEIARVPLNPEAAVMDTARRDVCP